MAAFATRFALHPNQISQWGEEFLANSDKVFSGAAGKEKEESVTLDALYDKIGQLEFSIPVQIISNPLDQNL